MTNANDIYEEYRKLVGWVLKRYSKCVNSRISYQDLEQEAWLAIISGLETFDETKGKESVYLTKCMRSRLRNYISKNRTAFTTCSHKYYGSDTADALSMSINPFSKTEDDCTFEEIVIARESSDINAWEIVETAKKLARTEDQFLIWKEWALDQDSYVNIGKKRGISKQRVQQIVNKLNKKLREAIQ